MKTIKYTKTYYEDIGKEEKTNTIIYAYCYYIYFFYITDNEVIRFRQYKDTPEKCGIFFPLNEYIHKLDKTSKDKLNMVYAILQFMQTKFNITEFYFFNQAYIPINTSNIVDIPNFVFEEVLSK